MEKAGISLSVDAVVFGYQPEQGLSILLIRRKYEPFKGGWALPGGFVLEGESLEEAVSRELKEETGVQLNYLEQLYTFGDPKRDPRRHIVSVAYFGLVRPDHFEIKADTDAEDSQWFQLDELPKLAFDHLKILEYARERLRAKISYEPIGFELLEPKFLFGDLENLYMSILGRSIDRRNFRKKMLAFGILDELDQKVKNGPGRPASLFQFNQEKYFQHQRDGFHFEI
ncbi:NUDIX hydrolase [Croceimicrobium hydrocarbonivorans]|uniref:NUDIX hydrolase n=1 Tax=Croceimicrobium hydrocarbonivorans TaxID=2761580 RepID=A0A7H0VEL8_9FLAO|nr:NUDIX domain-containing protein [Croceimicrobium hydrocarbonivorans]QNR24166.1 NUDIX hydrolase [Croceimicrobium hydrocarbonivorans]